jgi:epoxyqueuosine reductase
LTPAELARNLKERAREAGADLAGVAPAVPLPEAGAYQAWLAEGRQGTMDYMAREPKSREDIRAWYPDARSVLLCAFSYSGQGAEACPPGHGRVARYARLPDYHKTLKKRMRDILSWLKSAAPGADGRVFVDTSPVLERLYARYAGLGFIGKNTMLISPKLGSYHLLAGLALSLDLPSDEPVPDHCGSCNRCLSACPTQAFPEPRVLDASRCISYLTIEHRGAIPEGLRAGVGDWIMGCDVCQEVCPWNRFSRPGSIAPVLPAALPLEELASQDDGAFRDRFAGTSLTRPKRRGMARNALLAMGNSGSSAHRASLEAAARNADPVLGEQASWSLKRVAAEGRASATP